MIGVYIFIHPGFLMTTNSSASFFNFIFYTIQNISIIASVLKKPSPLHVATKILSVLQRGHFPQSHIPFYIAVLQDKNSQVLLPKLTCVDEYYGTC